MSPSVCRLCRGPPAWLSGGGPPQLCTGALPGPRPPPPEALRAPLSAWPLTRFLPCRTIGDRMGEAKASGNLGNTLKVLGRFDEAIVCCQRHLDIAQEQGDKVGCQPSGCRPRRSVQA